MNPLPLHATPPLREALGACLRPGGTRLTRHALALAGVGPAARVLDAGCGAGGSLALLAELGHGRRLGLDLDSSLLAEARTAGAGPLVRGDLARLPLATGCLDAVLCECVLSLAGHVGPLAEFHRVLRPGGRLLLADLHRRGPAPAGDGPASCLAGALSLAQVRAAVAAAGLALLALEEHDHHLKQLAGLLILRHGSLPAFWRAALGAAGAAGETAACRAGAGRPGYYLLIAEKTGHG